MSISFYIGADHADQDKLMAGSLGLEEGNTSFIYLQKFTYWQARLNQLSVESKDFQSRVYTLY